MEKGKLIVIEGACDGIGKSTQFDLLGKRLESENKEIVHHHFPSYGTVHGAPVEAYLAGNYGKPSDLSEYFITGLYAMDRATVWNTKLKPSIESGKIVLLDRYTTSSLIYQSALITDPKDKKEFLDWITDFEYKKLGIKEPDNVIFLHAPFDVVTEIRNARKQNEGLANDIHERDLDFMKRVYESAMFVADYFSWDKVKCNDGNKMRSIEDIHEDVFQLIKKK